MTVFYKNMYEKIINRGIFMINNIEIHIDFDKLESNLPKFECEFNFEGVKVYTTNKEIVFK